jgi:PAS domain S-box-containing protein
VNYETFFNTIDDFLFVLDIDGNIIQINDTVKKRLGYTQDELIGKSILMIHPKERYDEANEILKGMLNGTIDFCPIPIITKDGIQIPVETRVSIGTWNEKTALFGVTKDITKIVLSEEKFSKVFYLNPSACGLSDINTGKYIEVNDAFYKLLEFEKNEVIGKTAIELGILTKETINDVLSDIKDGVVFNKNANLNTKNGKTKHAILSAENINIQNKKYRFTVVTDITERKEAEKLQLLSNNILSKLNSNLILKEILYDVSTLIKNEMNYSSVGFRFKSDNDYPYYVQNGFEDNFILTENSIINNECATSDLECYCGLVISEKINSFFGSFWTNNLEGITLDNIINPRKTCINNGYKSIALIPIRINDQIEGLLQLNAKNKNTFNDIIIKFFEGICLNIGTTIMRKKAEEDLIKAKERAEQSEKLKIDFLTNMSHDLRTPINSIIGFSELLKNNNIDLIEKNQFLDIIIENGDILTNLINDIIDITKIDAGRLNIQKTELNINKLIHDLNSQYIKLIKNDNVKLINDVKDFDVFIISDKYRLKQILMNLLSNAVKFTKKGYIKFGYDIIDDKNLKIYVKDTGIGISGNNLNIIFNRYTQFCNSEAKKGSGLGLSISKSLVSLLEYGDLMVESKLNKGTTFYFIVPYNKIKKQ